MTWKTWEKRGKRGAARLLARALRRRGDPGGIPDLAGLSSILLVRTQNQLGDMLLATPAFRAVRERAPNARIDVVASPANVDAVRGSPRFDDVFVFDKRALWRRPRAARAFVDRLRGPGYDLALVVSSVDFSTTSVWLAAVSGASRRAGRPGARERERDIANDFFDWVLPPAAPGRHQSAVQLDLVGAFGAPASDAAPEIFPDAEESARGRAALDEALGPGGGTPRVLLHPGAGKLPNRWDARRFGIVAAALRAEGVRVAACCGPRELALLDELDRGAGARVPRLSSLPIRELAAAFRAAGVLVANDTGVLHVGAAAGAHVLALFGPTDPAQWCPSAPRVGCLRAPGGDFARLTPGAVVDAARFLVRHASGAAPWPDAIERVDAFAPARALPPCGDPA